MQIDIFGAYVSSKYPDQPAKVQNLVRFFAFIHLFVCVEVLPNGIMSSMISLPNHTSSRQDYSSKRLTSIMHILLPDTENGLS